jgi:predicted nucleotidyltransferase
METQQMIQQIAEYFKTQPVLKAWLFGSYSRGEERPDSDVDILVMYDRSKPIGLFKISGIHLDLERLLGKEVDLVEEKMLYPWVSERVNHDKKLIYERAH